MGVQIYGRVAAEKSLYSQLTNAGAATMMKKAKAAPIETALTSDAFSLIIMTSCRERPLTLMGLC